MLERDSEQDEVFAFTELALQGKEDQKLSRVFIACAKAPGNRKSLYYRSYTEHHGDAHDAGPALLLSVGGAQAFSFSQSLSPLPGPSWPRALQGGPETLVSTLSYGEKKRGT